MSAEKYCSSVIIDPLNPDDLPAVMDIERDSFLSPWNVGMFIRELASAHSVCLAARMQERGESVLAGYLIFWIILDEAHLHNLAVKKEYRGRGIAGKMLGTMRDLAAKNGVTAQTLEVRKSNSVAINLYRKCGFVVKGVRPHYYTDTDEDALIMWADVCKG